MKDVIQIAFFRYEENYYHERQDEAGAFKGDCIQDGGQQFSVPCEIMKFIVGISVRPQQDPIPLPFDFIMTY
ncbi:hypothetical protein ACFL5V_02360 [Fibrobacterota bacterium]